MRRRLRGGTILEDATALIVVDALNFGGLPGDVRVFDDADEAAGRSDVWETAYAGVWFVRHLGLDGKVATETIEICAVPLILFSHPDDRRAGAARLGEDLRAKTAPAA